MLQNKCRIGSLYPGDLIKYSITLKELTIFRSNSMELIKELSFEQGLKLKTEKEESAEILARALANAAGYTIRPSEKWNDPGGFIVWEIIKD